MIIRNITYLFLLIALSVLNSCSLSGWCRLKGNKIKKEPLLNYSYSLPGNYHSASIVFGKTNLDFIGTFHCKFSAHARYSAFIGQYIGLGLDMNYLDSYRFHPKLTYIRIHKLTTIKGINLCSQLNAYYNSSPKSFVIMPKIGITYRFGSIDIGYAFRNNNLVYQYLPSWNLSVNILLGRHYTPATLK